MFHLAWFVGGGISVHDWRGPWSGHIADEWMKPDLYLDLARSAERAGFDYVMLEDGQFVPDAYTGAPDWFLETPWMVPKNDPMPLVPLIGQATSHLGIVATMTTSFYPPFMAARLAATLDQLTAGRVGLNIVTAHNDRTAQNFGLARHYEHDLRYEMADEWMEVADKLWHSWAPGAVIRDIERKRFADPAAVRTIDHDGRFFKCRGPLNTVPGPQIRPVICQAGGSPAGRSFAARHADTILARFRTADGARDFRDDIRRRMVGHGRDPDTCKVLFMMSAIVDATDAGAAERKRHLAETVEQRIGHKLAYMSYASGVDFSKFDLDQPVPPITTNAARTTTAALTAAPGARTLREVVSDPGTGGFDFAGSAQTVARQMGDVSAAIGGDGFLVSNPPTRRDIAEITDGLAPVLRQLGLIRREYLPGVFRDNLLAF